LPEAPVDGAAHVEVDEATFEALLDGLAIAPAAPRPTPPRRLH
jgi:transposase